MPPHDSGLEQALAQLNAATPNEADRLEGQLAKATSRLPVAAGFDSWLQGWSGDWTVESTSTESVGGIECRRLIIAHNDRDLRAWNDILGSLKTLCNEPGVTVDRVDVALDPGGEHFAVVQIGFTARFRR